MKIRSLHIADYKVFKDFDIDFLDKEDKPLPIVVLAGVNGSGKTTLLEYLYAFATLKTSQKDFIQIQYNNFKNNGLAGNVINGEYTITHKDVISLSFYKSIIYLSVRQDNIKNIKETIRQKYIDRAFEIDKPSEALKELQNYIARIFDGLDLTFNLSSIDYNKDIVLFKDNNGVEFDIDDLSTGEKTLLSKVLYLFFENYKDKVILIDEPELSLHPSWQNKILKIYENFAKLNNCQIIIATHSPHIIGSAKNEYLRILRKNDKGKIEVIKDIFSYGRDIEWVLEEVMGTQYTREKNILNKIEVCQYFIDNEKYDEAEQEINTLEAVIGENDSEILTLRNDLAFERMDFEEDK